MDPQSSTPRVFDPRVSLATALSGQHGVYALLLGSGVSTGVGVPTGWGVVEALVRRAAVAAHHEVCDDFDWKQWWSDNGDGQELGYSTLVEGLASTSAARQALLATFFEPTEEEREQGLKIPGPAHRAIAKMVSKGLIRVIVTTNFDRLVEQALEVEGIFPQVISTDNAVKGMEPLGHSKCTVIKLHGDFASLNQRNTVSELREYPRRTKSLLSRVLDEYGLIISGWSGDWDTALVESIEANANRRYPLYWVSRSPTGAVGKRITARSGAQRLEGVTADEFFPDLLSRVEAIQAMTDSPASVDIMISRLKRALPNPIRHIEVRDLFDSELTKLEQFLDQRVAEPAPAKWEQAEPQVDELRNRTETLLQLFAVGVSLDRERQHTDLWVWVVERAMKARHWANTSSEWGQLSHYPALLVLMAGVMSALSAGHDDVVIKLLRGPTWASDVISQGAELPAWDVLNPGRVLNDKWIVQLPRFAGSRYYYPVSRMLKGDLSEPLTVLRMKPDDFDKLYKRAEYRFALAAQFFGADVAWTPGPPAGEYIAEQEWDRGEPESPVWMKDFLERGDPAPWGLTADKNEWFRDQLDQLTEKLKRIRRQF